MAEQVISSLFSMEFVVLLEQEVATIEPLGNFAHCKCFALRSELRPSFEVYIPCPPWQW
jgi:hypothetical protein